MRPGAQERLTEQNLDGGKEEKKWSHLVLGVNSWCSTYLLRENLVSCFNLSGY